MTEAPSGDYVTLAGFILRSCMNRRSREITLCGRGWRFEVVDIDAPRIDMILVQRQPNH